MPLSTVTFREGSTADLAATFAISERAMHESAVRQGVMPPGRELTDADIRADWLRRRALLEFTAAQPDGRYLIGENGGDPVAFARVVRFGGMENLTELMVAPDHQGSGIGRALLERSGPATPRRSSGAWSWPTAPPPT